LQAPCRAKVEAGLHVGVWRRLGVSLRRVMCDRENSEKYADLRQGPDSAAQKTTPLSQVRRREYKQVHNTIAFAQLVRSTCARCGNEGLANGRSAVPTKGCAR